MASADAQSLGELADGHRVDLGRIGALHIPSTGAIEWRGLGRVSRCNESADGAEGAEEGQDNNQREGNPSHSQRDRCGSNSHAA
jgi:hypothetical protein